MLYNRQHKSCVTSYVSDASWMFVKQEPASNDHACESRHKASSGARRPLGSAALYATDGSVGYASHRRRMWYKDHRVGEFLRCRRGATGGHPGGDAQADESVRLCRIPPLSAVASRNLCFSAIIPQGKERFLTVIPRGLLGSLPLPLSMGRAGRALLTLVCSGNTAEAQFPILISAAFPRPGSRTTDGRPDS